MSTGPEDLTPDQRRQIDELFSEYIDAGLIKVVGVDDKGQIVYQAVEPYDETMRLLEAAEQEGRAQP